MKKSLFRKAAAALLAAAMTVTYASADIYGQKLGGSSTQLSDQTTLYSGVWKDDNIMQSEKYIEYTPGGTVLPIVAYGSKLYGRSNLDYVSEYVKEKGYGLVAGVNGDFFEFTTGIAMGAVIIEGRLVADDNDRIAVGFHSDGSLRLGNPGIDASISLGSLKYSNIHINKELTTGCGLVLYTPDFAGENKADIANTSVVISPDTTDLTLNGTITGRVEEILQSDTSVPIPEDCLVLSVATHSDYSTDTIASDLMKLSEGDSVTITVTADSAWSDIQYAVGAGQWLVYDGQVQEIKDTVTDTAAARTAVGMKNDGTVVLYTVDEDRDGAYGVRGVTLAKRMQELGCTYAVNLDGGGSTAMAVTYPGTSTLKTVNQPSDGTQRKCANFIFLVNTAGPTGNADKLFIYPQESWMLLGASQTFSAAAADENWYAAETPIVVQYDGGTMGQMDASGLFTAGTVGTGQVYGSSLGMTGSATVNIVDTPSTIDIYRSGGSQLTSLSAAPAADIELEAKAAYNSIDLVCSNSCFSWETTGGIGTVDANGRFKAAYTDTELTGSIIVSCNGVSASIPVTVSPQLASGQVVLTFETDKSMPASDSDAMTLAFETDLTKVKYGSRSLRIGYDFSVAGSETPPSAKYSVDLGTDITNLALWVYGDGSGNALTIITADSNGDPDTHKVELSFEGWRYIALSLAENTATLKGIGLTKSSSGSASGTIWIDQVLASSGPLSDQTPPTISGSINGGIFSADISDNGATPVSSDGIRVTLDGQSISFSFTGGKLVAPLTIQDEATHRVRVTVTDACGNLAAASYAVSGQQTSPFSDMADHWADSVVTYLYGRGVVSGLTGDDGSMIYDPDSEMNREQFAVIITKWLGTDLTAYSDVQLPFEDLDSISWWALDAVKAAYSLGLIKGDSSGGVLRFNPMGFLTRAEAMTIIGRTQPRGYAEADLTQFSDSGEVPSWAAPFISTLISQGVVSGSNGMILPNSAVSRSQVAKMLCMLI